MFRYILRVPGRVLQAFPCLNSTLSMCYAVSGHATPVTLKPHSLFIPGVSNSTQCCLKLFSTDTPYHVLGLRSLLGHSWTFDVAANRVSVTPSNCSLPVSPWSWQHTHSVHVIVFCSALGYWSLHPFPFSTPWPRLSLAGASAITGVVSECISSPHTILFAFG